MRNLALLFVATLTLAACNENNQSSGNASTSGNGSAPAMQTLGANAGGEESFISADSANKMIGSYLTSVGAPSNDTNLRSIIIDANALRTYLTSDDGAKITTMKLMFGHTLSYINAGNTGKNCGYKTGALTIVLAGIDSAGNYVKRGGTQVMDNGFGCPHTCPVEGTSKSDLIPN